MTDMFYQSFDTTEGIDILFVKVDLHHSFYVCISGEFIWGPACVEGAYKCMVQGNGT